MKFKFIDEHKGFWPVATQCRVLEVSRNGYYDWRGRAVSARATRRAMLGSKAAAVFMEHRGRYGAARVHASLRQAGEAVSLNTVATLLSDLQLRARRKSRFVPRTTDSRHASPAAPNHLARDFAAKKPDRKWCCDLTYVPTGQGWLYVAAVIDLCSRRIVGWSMADHMRTELCLDALKMALTHRDPPAGLVHHSDRGVQYAAEGYQDLVNAHGLLASMSGKGDCYDNAVMESFWATLKTELTHEEDYATHHQARRSIFEYIETYYNQKRLHSTLGYQSPATFETTLK